MRVMNCYCGRDGKVKLIALGNALLEEHSPEGIGSYAAIINGYDEKLNQRMKNFLEGIGYVLCQLRHEVRPAGRHLQAV